MSEEFKAIETQEALDAIIKTRLDRNTKSVTDEVTKKYAGYLSPEEAQKSADRISALEKELETNKTTIADLTAKNSAYETSSVKMKIAREVGVPIELADRINGANEEEMKKDAEMMLQFTKQPHQPRSYSSEGSTLTGVEAAFYKKNPGLLRKE